MPAVFTDTNDVPEQLLKTEFSFQDPSYIFPPQPRCVVVYYQLPHPFSAQIRGCWLLSPPMEGFLTPHTPFSATSTKATTLPHNRLPQQPAPQPPLNTTQTLSRDLMVISASRICQLSHSSRGEWVHLITSAQRQRRTGHPFSLGPRSGSRL